MGAIMTTDEPTRERFGVVVGDAFSVFFRRFGLVFVLSLVPAVMKADET